jgi:hypothetical protein
MKPSPVEIVQGSANYGNLKKTSLAFQMKGTITKTK